ncbi:MAG: winged helix-turn-helix domain-containing protein [Candidatus Thiodiazotropha sp. (ex Monitilora ramsayi)]|nr:winged helix-turn-helix domain-containing protein [Candidatus Thiodiazotropha sp. (ex Monitilora ramsayi)]
MILRFADIEINTDRYELRRNGELVDVEPLVFDLLVHFVKHVNTLFTRDELMDAVWSGRVVSDATVSGCIKSARRALGDSGEKQLYIKTVHGRGFRFIGDVSQDQPQTFTAETTSTYKQTKQAEPSLIVLPFKCINGIPEINGFAEGLVANLETILTRIPLLRISAQASDYAHRNLMPTARQIHEEIGIDYLLEGNVQLLGDQVRINIQLIDAKSGFRLWAGLFEHALNEISGAIDGVVIDILSKLEPQLNRAIYHSVCASEGPPSARELYLEASGILALKGWHLDTFQEAAALLRRSSDQDPAFALAPAYLSLILALGHRVGLLSQWEQTKAEAIEAAEHALQLENMDSTVLGFAGCAMADLGLINRSLPILKHAVELNPANAQAWAALGSAYLIDRQPKLAIKNLTRGIDISPLDSRLSIWGALLALALMQSNDLDAAQIQAELACQRDDRTYLSRVVHAAVLLRGNNPQAALQALTDAYRIKPDLSDIEIDALISAKLGKQLRALAVQTGQKPG